MFILLFISLKNWHATKWQRVFALTGGAYFPFLALGWESTAKSLKTLILSVLPILFVSSLFFSRFSEDRNWMPLVFSLTVRLPCIGAEAVAPDAPTDIPAGNNRNGKNSRHVVSRFRQPKTDNRSCSIPAEVGARVLLVLDERTRRGGIKL